MYKKVILGFVRFFWKPWELFTQNCAAETADLWSWTDCVCVCANGISRKLHEHPVDMSIKLIAVT